MRPAAIGELAAVTVHLLTVAGLWRLAATVAAVLYLAALVGGIGARGRRS